MNPPTAQTGLVTTTPTTAERIARKLFFRAVRGTEQQLVYIINAELERERQLVRLCLHRLIPLAESRVQQIGDRSSVIAGELAIEDAKALFAMLEPGREGK